MDLLHRLLQRFGFDLKRFEPLNDPHLRRAGLLEAEGIELVVDGGANVGQYAQRLRRYGYAGSIVSIEPQQAAFDQLEVACAKDPSWTAVRAALGDHEGTITLHRSGNSVSSSTAQATARLLDAIPTAGAVGSEEVPLRRLDALGLAVGKTTLLKLDVQGDEQLALRGADGFLEQVALIELELSLVPLYQDRPTYLEMIESLSTLGFELVGAAPNTLEAKTGRLIELDAIFARRDD